MIDQLARYSGIPIHQIDYFLSLTSDEIYQNPEYRSWTSQIDEGKLGQTLPRLRQIYDQHLPAIKIRYGLQDSAMSGHTLGNWILGFLSTPNRMSDLLKRHTNVPTETVADILPEILNIVGEMPDGGAEWQQALVIFALPLLVRP